MMDCGDCNYLSGDGDYDECACCHDEPERVDYQKCEVVTPEVNNELVERFIADENIGFGAALLLAKAVYDPEEILEVEDMILRVVRAWNKTREFKLARPEAYGITVN